MKHEGDYGLELRALETIIDRLPIGAIVLDDDGIIRRFNRHEEQLSGMSRSDTLGRSFFSDVAPCTEQVKFGDLFRQGLEAGDLDIDFEFSFPYPYNRVPRDVRIRAATVQTEPNGLHVVLIEDITSRRQLERNNDEMMKGLRSVISRARSAGSQQPGGTEEVRVIAVAATLKGFGEYAAEVEPAKLFESVDTLMQRAVGLMHSRGASIDDLRGDGLTAFFPIAAQERRAWFDAARAGLAVIRLGQDSRLGLPFSVGISSGKVVRGPIGRPEFNRYTTLGAPMEVARAMAQAARPHEVLVDGGILEHVRDVSTHELLRGVAIPGVTGGGEIYRLVEVDLP